MKKAVDSKYSGCLFYSSNALARVLTKMAEEEFSITQLAPTYAFLLMLVNEKPGIQPKEISQQMQLTPSTVTRLLDKMESNGYLARMSRGKAILVHPTEKSLTLNDKMLEAWVNLHQRYIALLGKDTARTLTASVHRATKVLESSAEPTH